MSPYDGSMSSEGRASYRVAVTQLRSWIIRLRLRPAERAVLITGGGAPYEPKLTDADRVLYLQFELSDGNEDGPAWTEIKEHVWLYTTKVVASMIRKGNVWSWYVQLGGHPALDLQTPANGVPHDAAQAMAERTVQAMMPVLRDQLATGMWTVDGGAAIRTWATNLAVLRLPTAWRAWRTQMRREREAMQQVSGCRGDIVGQPDDVLGAVEFDRYMELVGEEIAEVLRLDCSGWTDPEISAEVEMTVPQVEYRLKNGRKTIKRRMVLEQQLDRRVS